MSLIPNAVKNKLFKQWLVNQSGEKYVCDVLKISLFYITTIPSLKI
jgi:hypothetical protein